MAHKVYIKKLTTPCEIHHFQKTFNAILGYSNVPLEYFSEGDCHAMFDGDKMVAGFCLVKGFLNLRAIKQLPRSRIEWLIKHRGYMAKSMADFTGYFITNKKYGLKFTIYLVKTCLFHPCNYFVYSYLVTEYGLEKYYGSGKPLRVHTGEPEHLPGHHETMEPEHVEILSKWGIVRIFEYRTKRWIRSWFKKKRH
jgi:hypothetical protein